MRVAGLIQRPSMKPTRVSVVSVIHEITRMNRNSVCPERPAVSLQPTVTELVKPALTFENVTDSNNGKAAKVSRVP